MSNLARVLNQLRQEHRQAQKEVQKLQTAIEAIAGVVGRNGSEAIANKRPRLSAAARRRVAQAQKARWAKARQELEKSSATKTSKRSSVRAKNVPPRSMSHAARRKIAAAQKARWAKIKTQQKKAA
jgi:hypothetical protein